MSGIISIVGGGWSFGEVDQSKLPGTIIAVNEAAVMLPRFDIAVTMDRLWAEARWDFLRLKHTVTYMRRNAAQNLDKTFPWLHIFDCDHTSCAFGTNDKQLNGRNSGYCALSLAYTLRPKELYLFGFDMRRGPNEEPYWYPPYAWRPTGATTSRKYSEWVGDFDYAARMFEVRGTQVVNVSSRSLIKAFPRATPEFLKMKRVAA